MLLALNLCCTRINEETGVLPEAAGGLDTKVLRLSDNYEPDHLLVKINDAADKESLAGLEAAGAVSISKVFPSVKGKEDLEARFGLDRWYDVRFEEGTDIEKAATEISALGEVSLVEFACIPERISNVGETGPANPAVKAENASIYPFNDPQLPAQWHYLNLGSGSVATNAYKGADVNVLNVWKLLCCGDPDIVVAVIDEGVMYNHPDLKDNMWVNTKEIPDNGIDDDGNGYIDDVYGYNFVRDTAYPSWDNTDDVGHGTHCAGTIAAVNNNGIGVSGIAGGSGKGDGCKIMSCQIFDGKNTSDIATAKAIKYAADNGASVISCSFGYSISFASDNAFISRVGSLEIDAIHYFEASKNNSVIDGGLAIFAASNDSHNFAHYPGAFYDIISVSAFGPDFLPTYYTNYGPGCNIAAPGGEVALSSNWYNGEVMSTLPNNKTSDGGYYGYMQGTSMACPHVSGVVALALSYAKKQGKHFGRDEFKQMILSSVNDIDQRIGAVTSKTYYRNALPELKMGPYYHQMGTGAIDAWRLCMKIDGTPCSTVTAGQKQWIDLAPFFGSAAVSLTYLDIDVPQSTVDALGLQEITAANDKNKPGIPEKGYGIVQFGRLYIHPTKVGSGKLTIKAVGGGDHLGGGNNPPGGMELDIEVSLISRYADGNNGTGGWL